MSAMNVPYGFCQCGCGKKTTISGWSSARSGWVKGEPRRFVLGHSNRKSPVAYVEQDRGWTTPCWVWQLARDTGGYGRIALPGRRLAPAHRVFYERARGPIPQGLQLDHLCRVRACVNPDHLEPVTHRENAIRGVAARRVGR